MRFWKKIPFAKIICLLLALGGIIFFLFWRYKLGLTRYFDMDELNHIHWAYALFKGQKPYTEFFYGFPLYFALLIAPVFLLIGRTSQILVAVRFEMFLVLLFFCLSYFMLIRKVAGNFVSILALFFFLFLPLPADKTIEARPDLIALAFALLGMYFFFVSREKKRNKYLVLSGFFYGLSLGFVQKTVFFLAAPSIIFLWDLISKTNEIRENLKKIAGFALGGLMAVTGVFAGLIYSGDFRFALYSISKMQTVATFVLGEKFFISANRWFFPIDAYYGFAVYSLVYYLNILVWFGGSLRGTWQAMTYLTFNKERSIKEFVIWVTFFINFFSFVLFMPLKHAQYLLPMAIFLSYYFALMINSIIVKNTFIFQGGKGRVMSILFKSGIILLLAVMIYQHNRMNLIKKNWTNANNLATMDNVLKNVPENEPLFDMTGEGILYRDGYFFCCIPYGQYWETFTFEMPDIEKQLKDRGTNYIHVGYGNRMEEITKKDANYIRNNFKPLTSDGSILVRK